MIPPTKHGWHYSQFAAFTRKVLPDRTAVTKEHPKRR